MKIYVGNKAVWEVEKYTFNDQHMGIKSVTMTVEHPAHCIDADTDIPDFKDATIEHNGENFYITSAKPTGEKSNNSINYKYTLVFNDSTEKLSHLIVRNLAQAGVDKFVSQGTSFRLYADLNVFAQLIQNNLDYYFNDGWVVNVIGTAPEAQVDINNTSVLELLKKSYEYYNVRWRVSGKTITIGYTPNTVSHTFDYGKDGGLVKISRTIPDMGVYNRVIGHGGTRNIPVNYFNNRHSDFPQDPNPISPDVNIRNLMPKAFRDSVIANNMPYADYAENQTSISEIGLREMVLQPNSDIYPSIAGVERPGIGRIDQIIAYEDIDERTFNIWVKDIGFDLADNQYTTIEEAKISFTTGMTAGYEYVILAHDGVRDVFEDTSKSHGGVQSKYRITLIKSSEDEKIGRPYIPNEHLYPSAGDSFVIYDIEMPYTYVLNAELRLQGWLDNQLSELIVDKPAYLIEPYDSFFEKNQSILPYLKSGNKITVGNDYLIGGDITLYISNISIEYGNSVVPKYTIVVSDKVEVEGGSISRLSAKIDGIADRQYFSLQEIKELVDGLDLGGFRGEMRRNFLSKINPDSAAGHITLNDGLTSKAPSYIEAPLDVDKKLTAKGGIQFGENYAPGLTGVGGLITEDARAFLRSLSLTEFLEAPEYRFNRIDVIAGDLWNTKGAGIIEEVDTVNQIITLKLEKGDIGRFRYDDIVMGIFHSFNDEDNSVDSYDDGIGNRRYSGFATSYFRVTQILDAEYYSRFRYELRPISPRYSKQFHPQPFMTCAQYGNFTNAERQTSMYQTTSYIRLLRNVNDWEFGIENIGMQWGDLNNLSIFGLDMTGYSAYMENVYFSGIIHQLSAKIKEQLDAQRVGGKNLLREYDIRFGFKYWGNSGEFTEFDMNMIESTPQLQVQPNTLNWTFPIRYGTVVVTANGVWNITTPNWVNAFPAVGSGNKNVDLKAGEYKGRNARVGTVAVQSGVIQRNVSISQAGLTEFVTIDPILNVGYGAQTVTITGKSNSRKLTFTTDTGYLEINLPAQYKVNGANVSNGSLIAGDPGALDEYSFSITVAVGENVEEFSIQNNIFATANGGQKAISTIVQRRTRVKVLADADNSIISIGDMIFHIN